MLSCLSRSLASWAPNQVSADHVNSPRPPHTNIHTQAHMHTCTHTLMHACTHAHTHTITHTCTHVSTHKHSHTHTCTHARTHHTQHHQQQQHAHPILPYRDIVVVHHSYNMNVIYYITFIYNSILVLLIACLQCWYNYVSCTVTTLPCGLFSQHVVVHITANKHSDGDLWRLSPHD